MFKAVIEIRQLRAVVDAITAMADEGRFVLSEDGIGVKAVDSSNVAAITTYLDQEAFETFEATPQTCGIDLVQLKAALRIADIGEIATVGLVLGILQDVKITHFEPVYAQ